MHRYLEKRVNKKYRYHLDQLVFPCCLQLTPRWHMRFFLACSTNNETKAIRWLPQIQPLTAFISQTHYWPLQDYIKTSICILFSANGFYTHLQYVNRTSPRLHESSARARVASPVPEGLPEATTIAQNPSHKVNCKTSRTSRRVRKLAIYLDEDKPSFAVNFLHDIIHPWD